jgi:hypothetical protein
VGYPTWNERKGANWIGHILRRNCLLKHVTEGKIEGRRRRERRRKQLLDYLKAAVPNLFDSRSPF